MLFCVKFCLNYLSPKTTCSFMVCPEALSGFEVKGSAFWAKCRAIGFHAQGSPSSLLNRSKAPKAREGPYSWDRLEDFTRHRGTEAASNNSKGQGDTCSITGTTHVRSIAELWGKPWLTICMGRFGRLRGHTLPDGCLQFMSP